MLVKFLKAHPQFAYFEGDDADLQPEVVQELVSSGHVIFFPGEEAPKEKIAKKIIPKN